MKLAEALNNVERGTCLLWLGIGINNNGDEMSGSVEDITEADQHDDWDVLDVTDETRPHILAALGDKALYGRDCDWVIARRLEYSDGFLTGREEWYAGFRG
jgi:hypothetical protein